MAPARSRTTRARPRARLHLIEALAVVAFLAAAAVGVRAVILPNSRTLGCRAAGTSSVYSLDIAQGSNATTIAAVAKRLGLPDHAVTVGIAAALQESKLRNLSGGDRDSIGIFQQRPSAGWGRPDQIMRPSYAAEAFFTHLAQVSGWEGLSVTDAAQAVQRSAAPDAYAAWEGEARVVASALTGETPAGFSCRVRAQRAAPADRAAMGAAMAAEVGSSSLAVPPPRGWVVAGWLVGHAEQFKLSSVSFDGHQWNEATGTWTPQPSAGATITVT